MSAWSHLPNAVHIDRIHGLLVYRLLVDAKLSYSGDWINAHSDAYDGAFDVDHKVTRQVASGEAFEQDESEEDPYSFDELSAAGGAIMALIAWPHSARLVNLTPEAVRVLASLGDDAAILLLPVMIALERKM